MLHIFSGRLTVNRIDLPSKLRHSVTNLPSERNPPLRCFRFGTAAAAAGAEFVFPSSGMNNDRPVMGTNWPRRKIAGENFRNLPQSLLAQPIPRRGGPGTKYNACIVRKLGSPETFKVRSKQTIGLVQLHRPIKVNNLMCLIDHTVKRF